MLVKGKIQEIRHVMDHIDSSESDSAVDLENGEITIGDDEKIKELDYNGQCATKMLDIEWSVARGLNGLSSSKSVLDSSENVEMEVGKEAVSLVKKKMMVEKWKKSNCKKPPKPPRPPGPPSLDEADMMLVREISELARLKHARIDRSKALRKKRGDKASSSIVNIFAMVITILFFIVVIFQGVLGSHI